MRRTDNKRAIACSPDEAFMAEADRAIEDGLHLFLATDNADTLHMMRQRYGSKLLYRRKTTERDQRWPRKTIEIDDVVDDMVDLWLLAACDYVVGSKASSYSRVAMLLNGSSSCRAIDWTPAER